LLTVASGILLVFALSSSAVAEDLPWPDKWWPSKWGADEEKGAFNTITPQKIVSSLKLVEKGKV
jgi:hypothetical protein